jgi:hypothetical protein
MIDEDWLKTLDFIGVNGLHFHGLVGTGAFAIVLRATSPEGEELAIKVRRHHLGFHLREIPLFMSDKPMYDVDRVNRKLSKLMGNDNLDEMTSEYDKLFDVLMTVFHDEGKDDPMCVPLLGQRRTPRCPEAWPFLFGTPMMRRRLTGLPSLTEGFIAEVVGGDLDPTIGLWKRELAQASKVLSILAPLSPEKLTSNPLFIWGAAVMDGFFTDNELPQVVKFLNNTAGPLSLLPDADLFLKQIIALSTALTCVRDCEIDRLVKLCGMLGYYFDVHDQMGRLVATAVPQN